MIEQIYNQLKTPKTIDDLYERLHEIGLNWNRVQVELFLQLDSNIKKQDNKYCVEGGNSNDAILGIIDKAMEGRPVVPVKKIMEQIPDSKGVPVSDTDIIRIAVQSGKYKSPNNAVIMRV